jgi:hypothetical protein
MTRQAIVFGILTLMAVTGVSDAQPRRADGGACGSTGTARKTGTDQQGNKLDCLWDTCTFTECSSSGGQISNCVQKTECARLQGGGAPGDQRHKVSGREERNQSVEAIAVFVECLPAGVPALSG